MGIIDSLKARFGPARNKVSDLAQQHGDKIDQGLDKAGRMVDEKTKGKYSDKIQMGTAKAKDAVDRMSATEGKNAENAKDTDDGNTPPSPPSAAS
ncbi:antitoxin [Streptomyces sp. NBC_00006]|uniref:antitoxin n=1 Tax=unclassified Streptomyces TaxID=2593676 RepID=UPI00224D3AE0|nr:MULTISPECIES: antitoxin [unclassified Streptomyces]MCX4829862.1 antitoxin [Streptomyces sp. NBC_01016]MCX5530808.1 antitoxin [Streptomyces sp. NBC_00006]